MSAAVDELLRLMAAAGAEERELVAALRASPLPLAQRVAERLEQGATLPEALADVLPPAQRAFFAGPRPGLAEAVLLVDQERRLRRSAVGCRIDALVYPLLCLLVLAGVAAWLLLQRQLSLGWGWAIAAGALLLGSLLVLGGALRLPALRWQAHLARAQALAQAALVARWRLSEAEARRCFGAALDPLLPLCGQRQADVQLAALAEHHRAAARRAARRQAGLAALLVFAAAASFGIAVATSIWGELIALLEQSAQGL